MPRVILTGPTVSDRHQWSVHTIIQDIPKSRFQISFPYKYEEYINDSIFKTIYFSLSLPYNATHLSAPHNHNHPHIEAGLDTSHCSTGHATCFKSFHRFLFCSSSSPFDVSFVNLLPLSSCLSSSSNHLHKSSVVSRQAELLGSRCSGMPSDCSRPAVSRSSPSGISIVRCRPAAGSQ